MKRNKKEPKTERQKERKKERKKEPTGLLLTIIGLNLKYKYKPSPDAK
jgi:hypothetical protein